MRLDELYDDIKKWYTVAGTPLPTDKFQFHVYQTFCCQLVDEELNEFATAKNKDEALDAVADVVYTLVGANVLLCPESIGKPMLMDFSPHMSMCSLKSFLIWTQFLGFSAEETTMAIDAVARSNWTKFRVMSPTDSVSTLEDLRKLQPDITHVTTREIEGVLYEVVKKGNKVGKHPLTYKPPVFNYENIQQESQGQKPTEASKRPSSIFIPQSY